MPISDDCLNGNKRFAVTCLKNRKDVVDEDSDFISVTHVPTPCT